VRDFSPEANREIAGQVRRITRSRRQATRHLGAGLRRRRRRNFPAYHQARYINEIAAAGKHELEHRLLRQRVADYPPAQTPQRRLDQPGIGYPAAAQCASSLASGANSPPLST